LCVKTLWELSSCPSQLVVLVSNLREHPVLSPSLGEVYLLRRLILKRSLLLIKLALVARLWPINKVVTSETIKFNIQYLPCIATNLGFADSTDAQ
jgi:hypothetical protein